MEKEYHRRTRKCRATRKEEMNDIAMDIVTSLGMPTKTLKMVIARERRNDEKFPNESRQEVLAVLQTLLDNRPAIIAKLQANGVTAQFPA